MDKILYSIPDARRMLGGIGKTLFYSLVDQGHIKLVKVGRRSMVADDNLRSVPERLAALEQDAA